MQLSLLGRTSVGRAALSPRAEPEVNWTRWRHIDLGAGAWIEVVRSWLVDQADLFDLLSESANWEHHERQMYERVVAVPRLVASCPGTRASRPWTGETTVRVIPHRASAEAVTGSALRLRQLQGILSRRYARALPSISLSLYRDGQDSVAFHGDRLGALRPDTVVAIASLGAPRHFLLRRAPSAPGPLPQSLLAAGVGVSRGRGPQRSTFALSVGEGDLLVMGGSCQETWEHAVPKQVGAAPRIAIMFRERADEGDQAPERVLPEEAVPEEAVPEEAMRNVRGPRFASAASAWRR